MSDTIISSQEVSIKNMEDLDEIKKKVLEKVKNGHSPNDILIEVYENEHLSRGNKLKISRYLILKGADRSLMTNNLARGSTYTFRKSIAKSKSKKSTFKKSRSKAKKIYL